MAGYVFAIGGDSEPIEVIKTCAENGVYSTFLRNLSPIPFEGTLADYVSMKPGDNIYFFCKRRYYGIGELINVGTDCKYCNYPDSSRFDEKPYESIRNELLVDFGSNSPKYRWICTFKASPFFFEEGIDTDEILMYKPDTFKMLRAFWKLSFIKLGDEENQSLKEIFLIRHQNEINTKTGVFITRNETHDVIKRHNLLSYLITPEPMLKDCCERKRVKHEMALEAAVIFDLDQERIMGSGHWDYISHQVVASPFKPIDYMDKIDIFAIRYLPDTKIPCKYLVMELKKDEAGNDTIDQVLKYVDWVYSEYAYSDYENIEACIIAAEYSESIVDHFKDVVQRYYTLGSHPVRNKYWNSLKLYKYVCNENGTMEYIDLTPV